VQVLRKEGRQTGTGRYGVYLGGVYLSLLVAELSDQPGRLDEMAPRRVEYRHTMWWWSSACQQKKLDRKKEYAAAKRRVRADWRGW
jgi:hypothetical protein